MCDSTFQKARRAAATLLASDAATQDHESGLRGITTAAPTTGQLRGREAVSMLSDVFHDFGRARPRRPGWRLVDAQQSGSINHHNED
jgi:hypothetical protein